MEPFSQAELESAQKAIDSTIRKNEKVLDTLSQKQTAHVAQQTLVTRNLRTLKLASLFVEEALHDHFPKDIPSQDLEEAIRVLTALIDQVEQIKPKFKEGTSQHTRAVRRIAAFKLARTLIKHELAQHS